MKIHSSWSLPGYAALADRLKRELQLEIVFCGSNEEMDLIQQIRLQMSVSSATLAGKTTLRQLAALLRRASLYIGSETGPLHIAVALGVPTVCIIGGGHYGRFFPYPQVKYALPVTNRLSCFGCEWHCHRSEAECITKVSVEDVWKATTRMLSLYSSPGSDGTIASQ
ncbi:MAG: glycosyltransferase family 9 protein [Candidatus Poribacteria bacterium]|nr:glycosyltransferase family 9 protein [Candidatus Poribacteria bacterium]